MPPALTPPVTPVIEKVRLQDLIEVSNDRLETLLWNGVTPTIEDLAGYEFRGYNHDSWIEMLGFRKFVKGFFLGKDGQWEGYNHPVLQNGAFGEWLGQPSDLAPKRFGFYDVYPVKPLERDNLYPHAVLLNYGTSSRNPLYEPARFLRDYLVRVFPDNPDLFLGKAYVALGPLRVNVGFFILERLRKHDFQA